MLNISPIDTKIHIIFDDYLDRLRQKGYDVIAIMLYGSQNYNLATKDSDADVYAIINPSAHTLANPNGSRTKQITTDTGIITVKDIRDYTHTLLGMGMNYLETLHTPYIYICDTRYENEIQRLRDLADDIVAYDKTRMCKAMTGIAYSALEKARRDIAQHGLDSDNRYAMKMLARAMHATSSLRAVLSNIPFEDAINAKGSIRYETMMMLKNGEYRKDFDIIPDMLDGELTTLKKTIDANANDWDAKKNLPARDALEDICLDIIRKSDTVADTHQTDNDMNAQEWLGELQAALVEDRAKEKSQASPLYYAIHDTMEQVVPDGYHDRTVYYDTEACTSMSFDELIEHLIDIDVMHDLLYNEILRKYDDEKEPRYEVLDEETFRESLADWDIDIFYVSDIGIIKPDTLFLTRDDAKAHLKTNAHHYTANATTYAMTAWRSPRYEKLIELLHRIDFGKSTIILKTED